MHAIRNYRQLASTPLRRDALDIIEAGLKAINTTDVVRTRIRLTDDLLSIGYQTFDLKNYRHVHVLGFGKASCAAAAELERILDGRITSGIALSNSPSVCKKIDICEVSHPLPSPLNVEHSRALVAQCEHITADDLVLVLVSGGGSAMLCWPESECDQGIRLYHAANRVGLTISELNTVRKHLSSLKGGGLVQLLHHATVVGIIFSDVPGDSPDMVASGPTYPDSTTVDDARAIIEKYQLGDFKLIETPKDPLLFDKTHNIVLVSNENALDAMAGAARRLGYESTVLASDIYDEPERLIQRFLTHARPHSVILGGGESRIAITVSGGTGGRNQHVALTAARRIAESQLFASVASDGLDNGDDAGAIIDAGTLMRAASAGCDVESALKKFDERELLTTTGNLIVTGPTGANVSDFYLLVTA